MPPRTDTAQTFALLGYGRFGRALAGLLHDAGHCLRVFDPQAEAPAEWVHGSIATTVNEADWIVLAMPVRFLRTSLRSLRPMLQAGQTVFDVGSVKLDPCTAMDEILGTEVAHVGTHPLFGPLSLARGEPRRTVVCPSPQHPQAAARVARLWAALGCEVLEQDPETHDRAMARTHVLAFFLAKGLIDIGVDDGMPMAPPSFQGMKHMLAAVRGDAGHLFSTIQQENPFAAEARAELLAELERIHRQLLDAGDDDALAIPARPDPP